MKISTKKLDAQRVARAEALMFRLVQQAATAASSSTMLHLLDKARRVERYFRTARKINYVLQIQREVDAHNKQLFAQARVWVHEAKKSSLSPYI
jgi:hypothetical protein